MRRCAGTRGSANVTPFGTWNVAGRPRWPPRLCPRWFEMKLKTSPSEVQAGRRFSREARGTNCARARLAASGRRARRPETAPARRNARRETPPEGFTGPLSSRFMRAPAGIARMSSLTRVRSGLPCFVFISRISRIGKMRRTS